MQLTPKQVAEVERWLAEKIMGWKWLEEYLCWEQEYTDTTPRILYFQHREGKTYYGPTNEWWPLHDPALAAMVREKARKLYNIILQSNTRGEHKAFVGEPYKDYAEADGSTEYLASSLAIALATGFKLEEKHGA